MKKLLFLLFILSALLPLHARVSAKEEIQDYGVNNVFHPLIDKRIAILECAQIARASANGHLERAKELLEDLPKIKNWRLKERLQVLIGSWISTAPIAEPRTKFLTVALALLADLVISEGFEKSEVAYQFYLEMSYATTCLAECQYYNQLSLKALNDAEIINKGWEYANYAIYDLTIADMLTISLEKRTELWNKGIGDQLSHYIIKIRKDLMSDMIQNRMLTRSRLSDLGKLLENFEEIVAEVPRRDKALVEKIRSRLKMALSDLLIAQEEWRIKQ